AGAGAQGQGVRGLYGEGDQFARIWRRAKSIASKKLPSKAVGRRNSTGRQGAPMNGRRFQTNWLPSKRLPASHENSIKRARRASPLKVRNDWSSLILAAMPAVAMAATCIRMMPL